MRIRQLGLLLAPLLLAGCIWQFSGCGQPTSNEGKSALDSLSEIMVIVPEPSIFDIPISQIPHSASFDFPVGPPDAKGYYNAQGFQKGTSHLGDDWNGVGGGNSDLGDPVYSIADGIVGEAAEWGGGWGQVVRILHNIGSDSARVIVESFYAHLDTMLVQHGQILKKGEQLGTIGNAGGIYSAHLHLEIRTDAGMELGGGYSDDTTGYTDPTAFIQAHRGK